MDLKALKMTYVELVVYILCVGLIYLGNLIWQIPLIQATLLTVNLIYIVAVNVLYSYHYCESKQLKCSQGILFSLLLSLMFIYTDTNGDSLRLVLPALLVNMMGLELMAHLSDLKIEIKVIPAPVTQYMLQLVPILALLIFLLFAIYFKNIYLEQLVFLFECMLRFSSSLVGVLCITGLTCYYWYQGIHGVAMIGTFMRPLWMQMIMVNFMAMLSYQPLPYIGTEGFYQWFVWIGGSGATLGLVLACKPFCKSQILKALGKDALKSSVFNINEQVIFGLPIAQNRYLMIPFFVIPMMNVIVFYMLMASGVLSPTFLIAPWVLPTCIGAVLSTGNIASVIYILISIVGSMVFCLPFILKYDHQLLEEERV